MSGWQVGDHAASDNNLPYCSACEAQDGDGEDGADGILTVVFVAPPGVGETECGLIFAGDLRTWCACAFRKIYPDEREACEPEFVTLLQRIKRKQPA